MPYTRDHQATALMIGTDCFLPNLMAVISSSTVVCIMEKQLQFAPAYCRMPYIANTVMYANDQNGRIYIVQCVRLLMLFVHFYAP